MSGTKKWLIEHLKSNYKYTFEDLEFDEDLHNEVHDVICKLENCLDETQAKLDTSVKALEYISEHGIPQFGASEKTWLSCYFSMTKRAEHALKELKGEENETK